MRISDWSSDVCSSDLSGRGGGRGLTPWLLQERLQPQAFGFPGRVQNELAAEAAPAGLRQGANPSGSPPIRDTMPCFTPPALPCCARSEEHTSELPSLMRISYAVFCLKKKQQKT